jgi:hypothetical protein
MTFEEAQRKFAALRDRTDRIDPAELDQVWQGLTTVDVPSILGNWKGGDFDTGHPTSRQLVKSRWYGKTFNSALDAKPLICRDENGELFSDTKSGNGEASLWMVEFRGEVTATMVYDGMPIFDHFKKVNNNTIMGIMNGKLPIFDTVGHYYFYLERV